MESLYYDGDRGKRINAVGEVNERYVVDGLTTIVSKDEWSSRSGWSLFEYDKDEENGDRIKGEHDPLLEKTAKPGYKDNRSKDKKEPTEIISVIEEIPAIIVTLLINFMTAIPFGTAYFPLGWSNDDSGDESDGDNIVGPFPEPGKEILGIRMYIFTCFIGQIALNLFSNFSSPVSVQLIENIPFYHAMAAIAIGEQGYGEEALSTVFFLFGLSSVVTGLMFYGLGKFELGKVVYYFPSHVLVGFIGGIGVFILFSSTGVTTGQNFSLTANSLKHIVDHFDKYAPAVVFEILLRILTFILRNEDGSQKSRLLAPIFFISIVPMYYLALFIFGVSFEHATTLGLFFPSADPRTNAGAIAADTIPTSIWNKAFDGHTLDIFRIIKLRKVSWVAITKSLATVIGVSLFSVANVPINIPAFANTCKVDVDMNKELIAHGYSNIFSGLFGGIQNVMTYSFSVLYFKSGGRSRSALWLLVAGLVCLFVFGVMVMPYIPRCLASTLLIHIGIDLVLEGVYDSYKEFDRIEYIGILTIVVVMTSCGMTPALVAGIVVAMTTYAIQNITYVNPIFTITTAETLRSSVWTRPAEAMSILDSSTKGRSKIMVIQLQANVFFGNIVDMVETIKEKIQLMKPIVVIIDFSLVVHMDSTAVKSINKLKNSMHRSYDVESTIFVMGNHRGYFPCQYGLSAAFLEEDAGDHEEDHHFAKRKYTKHLCVNFDEALVFAEDILIARERPMLLRRDSHLTPYCEKTYERELTEDEEKELAIDYVQNLIRLDPFTSDEQRRDNAIKFLSYFKREVYQKKQFVWKTGAKSDSAKLVVSGELIASIESESIATKSHGYFNEEIPRGCFIGELGLIDGVNRLSSVKCESNTAVLFSLDRNSWERMIKKEPAVARILDHVTIRYLSHRVQHVSNRIYETRCLPI